MRKWAGALSLAAGLASVAGAQAPVGSGVPTFGYRIQHAYPHDPTAFTQGLEYADGFLYESTGLNGKSSIRKVKLETGAVVQQRDVPAQYFGEGITLWQSSLIELTWETEIAFAYDRATFEERRRFAYVGEGWGLTHDASNLIMSDGTDHLRWLDPATFAEQKRTWVTAGGVPVRYLNELEMVKGELLANVWLTDQIARIDPATGVVTGWIDLTGLLAGSDRTSPNAVLNGIAYDQAHDRLFVTGKLWPKLFEIRIVPR